MTNYKKSDFEPPTHLRMGERVLCVIEMLVRMLGLVNGTITIHARGGKVLRGIEIVNKFDVLSVE